MKCKEVPKKNPKSINEPKCKKKSKQLKELKMKKNSSLLLLHVEFRVILLAVGIAK